MKTITIRIKAKQKARAGHCAGHDQGCGRHQDRSNRRQRTRSAEVRKTLQEWGYGEQGQYGLMLEVEDQSFLKARDFSPLTIHPQLPYAQVEIDPPLGNLSSSSKLLLLHQPHAILRLTNS